MKQINSKKGISVIPFIGLLIVVMLIIGLVLYLMVNNSQATEVNSVVVGEVSTQCPAGQYAYNETSLGLFLCSNVSFASLSNLPSGCSAGQYATAVTSSAFACSAVGWTQLTGYPSPCSSGYFVTGVGMTLTCTQVAWGNLINFPSGCPSGEYIVQVGVNLQCQSSYLSDQFNSTYGLVGYWPLDEQSGTIAHDVSGNNNTGNLINSPSWAVQNCPFNSCLNYSALAHQYIKLQNTNNFPIGANSRTIVMRIYVSHKDGSNSYSLFSYGATTFSDNKVFNFNCASSSDGCKLGFYDGNFAITTNIDLAVSSGQYMIAISTNNTSMAIYALNLLITPLTPDYIQSFTQQVKFTDSGLNTITGFGCLLCGYSYYGAFQNVQWFNGTASDIRIYNYTLSPIQLLNIFKNYPVQYPISNYAPSLYMSSNYNSHSCTDSTMTTKKMAGLDMNITTHNFSPIQVQLTFTFDVLIPSGTITDTSNWKLTYGTGSVPSCGASATGTVSSGPYHGIVAFKQNEQLTFTEAHVFLTFLPNTFYWFDLTINASSTVGWTYENPHYSIIESG